jgi:anti-sigma factor RsiW
VKSLAVMTEEFTSLAVAYLLAELDPAARARFEAHLAADPAANAELKAIADTLGVVAESRGPAPALPPQLRDEMLRQILHHRNTASAGRSRWATLAWPLAAAILLALNIAQWLHHRPASDRTSEVAATAPLDWDDRTIATAPEKAGSPVVPVASKSPRTSRALGPGVLPPSANATPAVPTIRQTVTFSISQATVTSNTPPRPSPEKNGQQQGAIELHNLPAVPDDRCLYLWAQRSGATSYEPVGEIPRPIYGGSGTINYQLRPGTGAAVRFVVTLESRSAVPASPSRDVVCAGP